MGFRRRNLGLGHEKRFSTSKTKLGFSGPSGRIFGCRLRYLMQNSMLFLVVVVRGRNSNFWIGSQNFRSDQIFGSQNFVAKKSKILSGSRPKSLPNQKSPKFTRNHQKLLFLRLRFARITKNVCFSCIFPPWRFFLLYAFLLYAFEHLR